MGFWKKKKQETAPGPVAFWLMEKKRNVKEWWVKQMVNLSSKLSISQQKILFIVICIFCCGYSSFLILQGFSVINDTKAIPINSIARPDSRKPIIKKEDHKSGEIARIRYLLSIMDSLKDNPSGKPQYDSIVRYRPGLLDTLKKLEEYYVTE
ncbi:hypothetical protein AMR72_15455 [Flavobacterium psychrophilum]|nr:hypothetical protein AMR72_15455 [Flavobacterium psychrophilum]AOE53786.1 hypothetical protein ALW18_15445 [Flavobacterium psychrophilum]